MGAYKTRQVPPALGERLQQSYGLPRPPATLGDLTALPWPVLGTATIEAAALCREGPSRHEIVIGGESRHTYCVLDTLLLPVIEGLPGTVRSASPLSGEVVELRVTPEQVEASPPEAVISFGVLREGGGTFYETGCPYINAFTSIGEYERWSEATPEAVTLALPVAEAFEFARDLTQRGRPGRQPAA